MVRASRSPQRSTIALDIVVGNPPGAIAFTWILCRPHLTARSRVKLTSPPLLVLYAIESSTSGIAPPSPATEAMLMILPPPCAIMTFPAACEHKKAPVRFTSSTRRQSSTAIVATGATQARPALFTRMSIRPSSAFARSTIARTSSALVTSQRRPSARTPSAESSAAVSAQRSALRAQSTTSAPISASAVAICRPSPLPPPVTMATRPLRSNSSLVCIRSPRSFASITPVVQSAGAGLRAVPRCAAAPRAPRGVHGAQVYPHEQALPREDHAAQALKPQPPAQAEAAGLWAMFIGPDAGGTGTGFLPYVYLNEVIGRSLVAPRVFGCQAPDTGNAEILHEFGTPEQKARWLRPLVAGEIRSFFAMTEPEVSGSDPRGLRARAERTGDTWVINAHKWFSSGAEGAAFAIVMAVTDPDAPPHERLSQIIVPADTPGLEIVRAIPTLGHRGRGWNTHCEVRFTNVRVPIANTLGQPGDGFRIAQKRLGPGRIHHVMRWLGQMQRAFDLMCDRALTREAFGSALADKQTIQNWIADSAAEIQACRLLTLQAAHRLDEGDEARVEISLVKFYAARVLHDVIDRAIQVHGALGLTDETPLSAMYLVARGMRLVDGPDEVHRMVVSRDILRSYRAGRAWELL